MHLVHHNYYTVDVLHCSPLMRNQGHLTHLEQRHYYTVALVAVTVTPTAMVPTALSAAAVAVVVLKQALLQVLYLLHKLVM
jgi:hypothetical protein